MTGERRKAAPRPRKPAGALATAEIAIDLAVEERAVEERAADVADRIDPLVAASVSLDQVAEVGEPVAKKRVVARVPYVLPKIIPGEPDPEPELEPESESEFDTQPTAQGESILAKVAARIPYKPQFRGVTKRLKRSLQPVVLPRHRPRVRRVTRVLRHIDTWSVFKIALLFNIFLYAVCLTAGAMLWRVALNTGTIENIERFFESFGWQTFQLKGGEIYHNAWIIGLFGVVGLTGLAVLAATMFNLITDLVGGVRLTVLEEEVVAREQRVVSWPRMLRPPTPPRNSAAKPPID